MPAGVRGLLSGASLVGHPIDTVGGYPRVVWTEGVGLVTQLAPGYRVAGDGPQRQKQTMQLGALKAARGGEELLMRLAHETPTRTLEVIGARFERGLPNLCESGTDDPSRALCTLLASLCGSAPPDSDQSVSWRDVGNDWERTRALLEHARIAHREARVNVAAIDRFIYDGHAVLVALAPSVLQRDEAMMVAVIAILVGWEDGTLARLVVEPAGTLHLISVQEFELDGAVGQTIVTQRVVFEPAYPPPSVSSTFNVV